MNKGELAAVILAAGQGKRMKSDLAKVLHKVCGRPMIRHVVDAARALGPGRIILIVGHQAEAVIEEMKDENVEFAIQSERLGTGHAVMQARPLLEDFDGTIMVLTGDTPLLRPSTLEGLLKRHLESGASATVLTTVLDDASGYGRIIKDAEGNFVKIVEHRDAGEAERAVREINSGIFCFKSPDLFHALRGIGRKNSQGEYYLTDVMAILLSEGKRVLVHRSDDRDELLGINDIAQLGEAERLMRENG
ncbi:MAG: NTP transferase domain-containing protein [Candidatus Krumholzibacteria bacterium]|nr:NTP transferase domain-containing protein [Candidatus Krumholzibacteria bacterium]